MTKPKKLLKMSHLIELGLGSRSSIYERMATGKFPRPVKLGRVNGWPDDEIDAHIQALIAAREAA